ncbi:MAG: Efflux ABC transporter, permease protein [Parcubacteria group bacterium GW2011_GWA2_47_12]|nr:MAG: Efflux ABC transporter, permease protein [Parcubacteria group bacterium GW2011_GWA2_47_12]
MDQITFKRIFKWGFVNFFRNGVVSVATVLVMSLSIFMIGLVIIGSIFLNGVITSLEEKVDISVYFKAGSSENEILNLQKSLEGYPDVSGVKYISQDEALTVFKERHANDDLVLQSLEVVEENPFSASLEIKAKDTSRYGEISKFLEGQSAANLIDVNPSGEKKITYRQNQAAIEKLATILNTARLAGFAVSLMLAIIAIMVAYNTVRLAIYNSKDEISVMQLVGASYAFIRGPFLVEGVMYGLLSSVFTLAGFYPIFWWAGQKTSSIFGGLNVFSYFTANILEISLILFGVGLFLGVFSSAIAIRKYLRV